MSMFYWAGALLGLACLFMIPDDVAAGRWWAVVINAVLGFWVLYLVLTRNK